MEINKKSKEGHLFRKFGVITIFAVFFLILVGGIVRSTGSGLGCPDWPKCFGQWVPPTDVSQLPDDYKIKYAIMGKEIADFSALHTWIEYVNRLIGVLIGFFVFLTLVFSTSYWKSDKLIVGLALAAFVLVGFNGWLGAIVVATNLKPVIITAHMLLALFVVAILIFAVTRSYGSVSQVPIVKNIKKVNLWLGICLLFSLVQVALGSQVREAIDVVAHTMGEALRNEWVHSVGLVFYIHRSFSIAILAANVYLVALLIRNVDYQAKLRYWSFMLIGLLGMEVLTGVIMAYFAIPAFLQPVHLLLGSLMFGLQFYLALVVNYNNIFKQKVVTQKAELV